MVSDFFYPNMGGVESHLYQLSICLMRRGHKKIDHIKKIVACAREAIAPNASQWPVHSSPIMLNPNVVIVTHSYGNRKGVRYLTNGLKVYYVPYMPVYQQSALPTIFSLFPILRNILIREQIEIVHGHQALSSMCHEAIIHAKTMGLKTCFTDHSLFGFADAASILTNKLLKFTLSDNDHVICVSNTSKENTVLRASLNPSHVSVIPNAVVASQFSPDPTASNPNFTHKKVRFLIAGDGPKKIDLEQMREKYNLHDRVEFLGSVKHSEVRNVLVRGNVFLNTSLTEAFCISILEAACAGLLVVSTKVGGVPEVLPNHMIRFSKPEEDDLVDAILNAVNTVEMKEIDASKFNEELRDMYSWNNVAERTEKVYTHILKLEPLPFIERLRRFYGCGPWSGKLFCFFIAIDFLFLVFLEWWFPHSQIDVAPDFSSEKYFRICKLAEKKNEESL